MFDLPPVYIPPLPQEAVWLWYLGPQGWWWTDNHIDIDIDAVKAAPDWFDDKE